MELLPNLQAWGMYGAGHASAAGTGQGGSSVKEVVEEALKREDYQAAFLAALEAVDDRMVEWLCQQLDPYKLFSMSPMPLEQSVVLSLLQQLGVNLHKVSRSALVQFIRELSGT